MGVLTNGIVGVKLIRYVWMVHSGHALADTRFHQAAKRGQHIDWRIDLTIVQRSVYEDLAFCDVTSEVWDRMRDVVIGHREDWKLRDRTIAALDTTSTLIDSGQVCIHHRRPSLRRQIFAQSSNLPA